MTTNVVALLVELERVSDEERRLKAKRIELEELIAAETNFRKPEGSESFKLDELGYEIGYTIKQNVSFTFDPKAYVKLRSELPKDHPARRYVKQTYTLSLADARKLQAESARAWSDIHKCVQRKPGKVTVSIKKLVKKETA